jgi:REP element-mobilizing transposase RayT
MARKPRLHVPGGLYHVIQRGNARQDIFLAPEDRLRFYELLAEGVARFGYRVHAFCLMTNHVHLALQAGEEPLSVGMQNLGFRYTQHLNRRLDRVGHVLQGRFKAYLVDQDRYGLALVRYIHLNPVRARMVRDPAAYRWSSHRAYLGREHWPWLTTDWVLGQFAATAGVARRRFAEFVQAGKSEGHSEVFYGGKADARVVGEEDFLKRVIKPARPAKRVALPAIVAYVCGGSGQSEAALAAPGRNRAAAQARTLIAWLALHTRACTLAELATRFNRSPSTLSHLLARLERLSRSSGSHAEALQKHLHTLIQA